MKTAYILALLSICSLHLLAQDLPADFYVTMHGDTVYGRCIIGGKYIVLQKPKGEKVKLKSDSIASYTIYTEFANWKLGDPAYHVATAVSIANQFYEVVGEGDGPVRVVFLINTMNHAPSVYEKGGKYYFEKKGALTEFQEESFYKDAQKYMADCPDVITFMSQVPNKGKAATTHKAKMGDLPLIVGKYNECAKGK